MAAISRKLLSSGMGLSVASRLPHRATQPHPVDHMGSAEMTHQRLAGFVLQLLKVGGTDRDRLLLRPGFQLALLIVQHPEHHLFHRYLLDPKTILSALERAEGCSC